MKRLSLPLLATIFFAGSTATAGQKGVTETIVYLGKLQAEGGGYRPNKGAKASLRATTAAIRAIHYVGGDPDTRELTISYIEKCYDSATGGFRDNPSAKPDLFSTAVGVMAVVELKVPRERMTGRARKQSRNPGC